MKHIIQNLIAIVILFTFAACESLLDKDVDDVIGGEPFTTETGIEEALLGAYSNLAGTYDGFDGGELFGGDFIIIPSLLAVESSLEAQWDFQETNYSNFLEARSNASGGLDATNSRISANWRRAYETINLLNNIIANINVINSTENKNRIEGEAKVMRGLLYFELVRLWAPQPDESNGNTLAIPLILDPITSVTDIETPVKSTLNSIYTQVINDLESGSQLLKGLNQNPGNLNYYAAQAFLMRVSMQLNRPEDAIVYADEVLSGPYELNRTPLDCFNNNNFSPEDIFGIMQTSNANAGGVNSGTGITYFFSSINGEGVGAFGISESSQFLESDFFDNGPQFSDQDLRYIVNDEITESTSADDVNALYTNNIQRPIFLSPAKYLTNSHVIPVIRLAEIYLTRAEAISDSDIFSVDPEAIDNLNTVRTRAGLDALETTDFLGSDGPDALYDSILLERNRELLYEGQLFHDLKRQNGLIGTSDARDSRFILPIPESECEASPGLCD
ncbi:RagB/SusD family nutrient uptake outer membrane protein [Marinoscillum pacificum]|uniref:RagB/SusD family nutrient uptake outer membrane protein n=1 Tax=Marinoscillum pacificum TaxID=392723 RepID=UPI0021581DAA|nr:RagB/SusD family nutrient uptake outer membrane protein [Marinoscillum pacificum]